MVRRRCGGYRARHSAFRGRSDGAPQTSTSGSGRLRRRSSQITVCRLDAQHFFVATDLELESQRGRLSRRPHLIGRCEAQSGASLRNRPWVGWGPGNGHHRRGQFARQRRRREELGSGRLRFRGLRGYWRGHALQRRLGRRIARVSHGLPSRRKHAGFPRCPPPAAEPEREHGLFVRHGYVESSVLRVTTTPPSLGPRARLATSRRDGSATRAAL